jgi:hypothetical protein
VTPSHRRDAVTSEPVTTSLFDLETDIAAPDLARLDQRRAGILTISQRTWTALISIFSLGLMTLFSSQPVAFAENFPSRPSSSVIVLVSVLRRILGRSFFWGPPVYWSRNLARLVFQRVFLSAVDVPALLQLDAIEGIA